MPERRAIEDTRPLGRLASRCSHPVSVAVLEVRLPQVLVGQSSIPTSRYPLGQFARACLFL